MEGDVPEDALAERADLSSSLSVLGAFRGLPADAVAAVAAEAEWHSLPGATELFAVGEPSDSLYVLLSGYLATLRADEDGTQRIVGRISAGETVGEIGLLSGRPRSATVVALRDSELLRVSRPLFDRLLKQYPSAILALATQSIGRTESPREERLQGMHGPHTFAIVPQSLEVDVARFAVALVGALSQIGKTELVWSVRGADHTSHWFHKVEAANQFVVYVAEHTATAWTKLCLRQADALLLLANAEAEPGEWPALADSKTSKLALQRSELVLLHEERLQTGRAVAWTAMVPGVPHHHVTGESDTARLARIITGRAIGLVLSGGGARGFAHLGAVKALRQFEIPLDLIGGTSIGAIMGAAVAHGWQHDQLVDVFRRTFVDSNPLGDYTLPIYSLVTGRRVSQRLRREFGSIAIEDLPLPYFCVSTNLTTGTAQVHRQGELWRWLRASVAIPGVLPPVMYNGAVFVDGATINNLPVDVMREVTEGMVIGVDVGADRAFTTDIEDTEAPPFWKAMNMLRRGGRRPNIFQVLWRSGMVNSATATAARRRETDLLLQPHLESVDMLNWKAFERAIDAGYSDTCRQLEAHPELVAAARGKAH